MDPSPIPRWDIHKLNGADCLFLFGAGREKRIYAIPPYTKVAPLEFEDYRFEVESFPGALCALCGASDTFLDEVVQPDGSRTYTSTDPAYCDERQAGRQSQRW